MTNDPSTPDLAEFDARKAVYEQDVQFYKYRDGLKWSRLWSIWLIEGSVLYVAFQAEKIYYWEQMIALLFSCLLIGLMYWLAKCDEVDANDHLTRIKRFEENANAPFERTPTPWRPKFMGVRITAWIVGLLFLFNFLVALRLALPHICLQ